MKWQAQATALQSFQEIKESDPGIVGTKSKSYLCSDFSRTFQILHILKLT